MNIPDLIVAMQLRNCAGVLESIADDKRMLDHYARDLKGIAFNLRSAAAIIEHLPPFVPD